MIDTKALRQKILDMAIKGKLVPQDPNDEPASVLLERIRAEKQQLIKEGKIKKDKNDSAIFKGDDNRYYEKVGSEVKDITDEVPFETPDSWAWTRFSTLIRIISGVSYDKNDVETKGIRILRGGNINDLKVTPFSDDVYLPETYYDPDKQVQIDDVLIVASTGSKEVIGKAGYVIEPLENTQIGAFLRIVRPILKWYAPYVKLIFATEYYREHIRHLSGGTNINNIKADYINVLLISLPPYAEQIRIAERINSLFEQIDIIEQNQADIETAYEEFKKRTLTLAIQGKLVPQDPNDEPASVLLERICAGKKAKLGKKYVNSYIYKGDDNCYYEKVENLVKEISGEIPFDTPESWQWIRVDNLFQHNTGKALNSSNTQGVLHPYITTSNVYWGCFNLEHIKEMPFTQDEFAKCSIVPGDLLVCEGGDVGRAAIWEKDIPMCIQNHIHRLRAYNPVCTAFYYFAFFVYKSIGLIGGKGIGIQGLSSGTLGKLIFPLPPLAEQERIVKQVAIILEKLKDEV